MRIQPQGIKKNRDKFPALPKTSSSIGMECTAWTLRLKESDEVIIVIPSGLKTANIYDKSRETKGNIVWMILCLVPLYSFLFSIYSLHHCYTLNEIKCSVAHERNSTKAWLLLITTSRSPRRIMLIYRIWHWFAFSTLAVIWSVQKLAPLHCLWNWRVIRIILQTL